MKRGSARDLVVFPPLSRQGSDLSIGVPDGQSHSGRVTIWRGFHGDVRVCARLCAFPTSHAVAPGPRPNSGGGIDVSCQPSGLAGRRVYDADPRPSFLFLPSSHHHFTFTPQCARLRLQSPLRRIRVLRPFRLNPFALTLSVLVFQYHRQSSGNTPPRPRGSHCSRHACVPLSA